MMNSAKTPPKVKQEEVTISKHLYPKSPSNSQRVNEPKTPSRRKCRVVEGHKKCRKYRRKCRNKKCRKRRKHRRPKNGVNQENVSVDRKQSITKNDNQSKTSANRHESNHAGIRHSRRRKLGAKVRKKENRRRHKSDRSQRDETENSSQIYNTDKTYQSDSKLSPVSKRLNSKNRKTVVDSETRRRSKFRKSRHHYKPVHSVSSSSSSFSTKPYLYKKVSTHNPLIQHQYITTLPTNIPTTTSSTTTTTTTSDSKLFPKKHLNFSKRRFRKPVQIQSYFSKNGKSQISSQSNPPFRRAPSSTDPHVRHLRGRTWRKRRGRPRGRQNLSYQYANSTIPPL